MRKGVYPQFPVAILLLAALSCGGDGSRPQDSRRSTTASTTPSATMPAQSPSAPSGGQFDGEWVFTAPANMPGNEFMICEGGCIEILGKETNLAKSAEPDVVTFGPDRVTIDPALWSIPCTGGGGMTHEFRLVLVSDGADRLVAPNVRMPGGGCDGMGPATVSFVAVRAND